MGILDSIKNAYSRVDKAVGGILPGGTSPTKSTQTQTVQTPTKQQSTPLNNLNKPFTSSPQSSGSTSSSSSSSSPQVKSNDPLDGYVPQYNDKGEILGFTKGNTFIPKEAATTSSGTYRPQDVSVISSGTSQNVSTGTNDTVTYYQTPTGKLQVISGDQGKQYRVQTQSGNPVALYQTANYNEQVSNLPRNTINQEELSKSLVPVNNFDYLFQKTPLSYYINNQISRPTLEISTVTLPQRGTISTQPNVQFTDNVGKPTGFIEYYSEIPAKAGQFVSKQIARSNILPYEIKLKDYTRQGTISTQPNNRFLVDSQGRIIDLNAPVKTSVSEMVGSAAGLGTELGLYSIPVIGNTFLAASAVSGTQKALNTNLPTSERLMGGIEAGTSALFLGLPAIESAIGKATATKISVEPIEIKIPGKETITKISGPNSVLNTRINGKDVSLMNFNVRSSSVKESFGQKVNVYKETFLDRLFNRNPKLIYEGNPYKDPLGYKKATEELLNYGIDKNKIESILRYTEPKYINPKLEGTATVLLGRDNPEILLSGNQITLNQNVPNTRKFTPTFDRITQNAFEIGERNGVTGYLSNQIIESGFISDEGGFYSKLSQQGKTTSLYEQLSGIKLKQEGNLDISSNFKLPSNENSIKVYHFTPDENLPGIFERGLIPSKSSGIHGVVGTSDRVFTTLSKDVANNYRVMLGNKGTVLEINIPKDKFFSAIQKDAKLRTGVGQIGQVTFSDIPKEWINIPREIKVSTDIPAQSFRDISFTRERLPSGRLGKETISKSKILTIRNENPITIDVENPFEDSGFKMFKVKPSDKFTGVKDLKLETENAIKQISIPKVSSVKTPKLYDIGKLESEYYAKGTYERFSYSDLLKPVVKVTSNDVLDFGKMPSLVSKGTTTFNRFSNLGTTGRIDSLSVSNSGSSEIIKTKLDTDYSLRIKDALDVGTSSVQGSSQNQNQNQNQVQKVNQSTKLNQPSLNIPRVPIPTINVPGNPNEPPPKKPFKVSIPKFKSKQVKIIAKPNNQLGKFTTLIRRKGKFIEVGKSSTLGQAEELGKNIARKDLSASVRVKDPLGRLVPLAPSQEFVKSRSPKDPFSLIQKSNARLSNPLEVKSIIESRKSFW